ncbi:hypothetical protein C4561_03190 [candidate division WWE3 bacterium]|jgi:hypothetical protein|uniref:Uncharacterized protein n=1 Tax=candidate division WWE3 bacterium TaxID=2053526 RepID=A0A3A4ZD45_UNCKA|nr:MAG: hypothetical protein C4561_03190 [candidate division WWE3 bacterium]
MYQFYFPYQYERLQAIRRMTNVLIVIAILLAAHLFVTLFDVTGDEVIGFARNAYAWVGDQLSQAINDVRAADTVIAEEANPTQSAELYMNVHNFEDGEDTLYYMQPEAVEDIMKYNEIGLPEPTYVGRDDFDLLVPHYAYRELPLAETWVVNKSQFPWLWVNPIDHFNADDEPYVSWQIGTYMDGQVFTVVDSESEGYYELRWTATDGEHVQMVPDNNMFKISTCDQIGNFPNKFAAYIQVKDDGMLVFHEPAGEPVFSMHAVSCGYGAYYLAWDAPLRIPFGVIEPDSLLKYYWHNQMMCREYYWNQGLCWSYETDVAR